VAGFINNETETSFVLQTATNSDSYYNDTISDHPTVTSITKCARSWCHCETHVFPFQITVPSVFYNVRSQLCNCSTQIDHDNYCPTDNVKRFCYVNINRSTRVDHGKY